MNSGTLPAPRFVTTASLAVALGAPNLVVIDGSWYLPTQNRDARAEYLAGHIPGAVFFDIDTIADTSSGLPHMLAQPEAFAAAMGELGLGDGMRVVVYDGAGLFSAPRVAWTLRVFGVADVAILEGGLPQWRAEGRLLESGPVKAEPRIFTARLDRSAVAGLDAVRHALQTGSAQVVDCRPAERFRGDVPEPRPGVRAGHMPGSLNLPFPELIENGRLKPAGDLTAAFRKAGVDPDRPVITSCGSGVSAAILSLALEQTGCAATIYDGSWAEWGSRPDLPIAMGEADFPIRRSG